MKVAFINLYSGVNNRGAESFAHELAKKLSAIHDVSFFTGKPIDMDGVVKVIPIQSPAISPQQGFGFGVINDLRKRLFLDSGSMAALNFTLKVLPKLWQTKPDLIIPMNGFWQVILCKTLSFFYGGKILVTGHSGPGWDERWNLYLKPHVFVATTEPTAQWAKKICPWTRVVTIPYGIDVAKYANAKPIELALEKPIILCPAAAVRYKRVELTIKAVAKLKKGSLLYLGTGPLVGELKELGEKLLGRKRFLNDTVPQKEMPSYYVACDLVTLPSTTQENSPMVFFEAMAAGKIVVTTEAPRSHWILADTGVFINPENIIEYAKALEEAINKKDAKEIAQKRALEFSWEKVVKKYEKVIASL